jgi:hypothetical protein
MLERYILIVQDADFKLKRKYYAYNRDVLITLAKEWVKPFNNVYIAPMSTGIIDFMGHGRGSIPKPKLMDGARAIGGKILISEV